MGRVPHLCHQFYEQVEQEDFDLCVSTQKGLNAGIYSSGVCALISFSVQRIIFLNISVVHPRRENGVIFYHQRVKGENLFHCI